MALRDRDRQSLFRATASIGGNNVNQGGNFWRTLDARFIYRRISSFGKHIVSFAQ